MRVGLLCGALLLAAGCSPARMLSTLTPSGDTVHAGTFTYGSHPRQRLDVYRPAEGKAATGEAVVFFYGGRWQDGERGDYRFVANALTAAGIITVIPDYRLYPEIRFPSFVEDGAAAVRWTQRQVARFGGDPRRVFVMGHSAGAHIAALLAFDERYLGQSDVGPGLAGFIGLAGPYDFLPLSDSTLQDLFAPPERYPESQPVNFVDGGEPPALLLHGADDAAVWPRNTRRLAATIARAGGVVSTCIYSDIEHAEILGALAWPLRGWAPVRKDVLSFIAAAGTAGAAGDGECAGLTRPEPAADERAASESTR